MTKWMTVMVTVVVAVLLGSALASAMCWDDRKNKAWPDKQKDGDFEYCFELYDLCPVRILANRYNKPIPNWNRRFPLSNTIGDHCGGGDYRDYAYAYLVGQLRYCGTDSCPESVLDLFPAYSSDLSLYPDTWVPYARTEKTHVGSVTGYAGFVEDATDYQNMEGADAQKKEEVLRDMYRSANYFTLGDKPDYVNQACGVSTESELKDALTWAAGFRREFPFSQVDKDYVMLLPGVDYSYEKLGVGYANWAFDHMCTTGARKSIALPQEEITTTGKDGQQVKGYKIIYPDVNDPKNMAGCDGSACGEVFADQQVRVIKYLLLPKICRDNGKVETTAKPPTPAFPVMWKRVHAAQYLAGSNIYNKYAGCLLSGNDASDIKPVTADDVVTYDAKGKATYKIEYVWIQDTVGCWESDCVIEKTIQLKSDITVSAPITISKRAEGISHIYEMTVTGKNKDKDYKITTTAGFKPVNAKEQNGLFNMVEDFDRLLVSDVEFESELAALVSGPGSTSVLNSTVHSKMPLIVRDGSTIVNNVFKPSGTGPFVKVADGATYFTIQKNTFGSGDAPLPNTAIEFGKLGATCLETNPDYTCKKYDTADLSGLTYHNVMNGYVLNDKLSYVKNDAIAAPVAAPDNVAVYHSGASGECNAKLNSSGIGCYALPITLKPGVYAVEVFAVKTNEVVPLGLFCTYKANTCVQKLEVDPKVGGVATLWMREDYKDKNKPSVDQNGKPLLYQDGTPVLNSTQVYELGVQPDGKILPVPLRMMAYGRPLNASLLGAPSALSAVMSVNFIQATITADDVSKAQSKYMNWLTGPVVKWAYACVDNKTCTQDDKDCKMSCGWVNACAELQQEIDRLAYCKFDCKKKANAEMTSGGVKIGYQVCAEMDFTGKGGDRAKCEAAGGIYENKTTGYSEVVFNQQMDAWVNQMILDPKDAGKQPGLVATVCQAHTSTDLKQKFMWKNFGGTLDYQPEDPLAVACYWDPVSKQQTGQYWDGGTCVSTNKSKCIWDDTAKVMTGKFWDGSDSAVGKCYDNKEASACLQTKGMVWLEGKCQSEKDVCIALGKVYSDSGKCQCPSGTLIAKDGSCVTPPPSTGCKSTEILQNGICVVATTNGAGPQPTGGDTSPGQSATTPAEDKKPLMGVGGEVVQQAPEASGGDTGSSAQWHKFWGCSLVR